MSFLSLKNSQILYIGLPELNESKFFLKMASFIIKLSNFDNLSTFLN